MADNWRDDPFDMGGQGFRLPTIGDQKPAEPLQELEGITVPDISKETASEEDRLVKVWKLSPKCNAVTFGFFDVTRDLALVPPGTCCRDEVIEVPLSEAKAKGYTLFTGDKRPK